MNIDWNNAPDWANYAAMDNSGEWCWFVDKPRIYEPAKTWISASRTRYLKEDLKGSNLSWNETLQQRPEKKENLMQVKIKKLHPNAVIPTYAKDGDAGLDITYIAWLDDKKNKQITYFTGICIEIPSGFVGLLFPRSSISKKQLSLANSVGVIDSGYRGEIKVVFNQSGEYCNNINYEIGDKIAQLIIVPYPQIELIEVDELTDTERGSGGFGSTGN